ncbi:hypothetical protein BJX64DRAFT_293552 [Aspergillus heterothallicus]
MANTGDPYDTGSETEEIQRSPNPQPQRQTMPAARQRRQTARGRRVGKAAAPDGANALQPYGNTNEQQVAQTQQKQQPGAIQGGAANQSLQAKDKGKDEDTGLKLRLDLNLDIEVELKAQIHGDLTLALL